MLITDHMACWYDEMAEAEDFIALLAKQKNYVGLRVQLDRYFKLRAKIDAAIQISKSTGEKKDLQDWLRKYEEVAAERTPH